MLPLFLLCVLGTHPQVFRNPTDRVRSFFSHFQPGINFNQWAKATLAELNATENGCWDANMDSPSLSVGAFCASAYVVHLLHWLELFEERQFLLLPFSQYLLRPGEMLAAVGRHLEIASDSEQQHIIETVTQPYHANDAKLHSNNAPADFDDSVSEEVTGELAAPSVQCRQCSRSMHCLTYFDLPLLLSPLGTHPPGLIDAFFDPYNKKLYELVSETQGDHGLKFGFLGDGGDPILF
jgi:hypothetical protein